MTKVFASALISMAKVEPNLGRRVKFGGLLTLGIRRRVSSPFLVFVMCTRRRRIPTLSKRTHDIPSMEDPQLPVYALTMISMERLDQGCDRRVESDFNTDSYYTVLPNLGRDGECRKRPSAHASARLTLHRVSTSYIWNKVY